MIRAMDVMTSGVITVGENATVPQAAKLLAEHGISAVPVVDKDNRVTDMVSEGELLHRAETGTERRRSWWFDMVSSTNKLAGEYIKPHSGKVKDVMTRDVLSVAEEPSSPISPSCSRPTGSSGSPSCATASSSGSSAGRTSCGRWR